MTVVAELVATLGMQVDAASFQRADNALKTVAAQAQQAVQQAQQMAQRAQKTAGAWIQDFGGPAELFKKVGQDPQKWQNFFERRGLEAPPVPEVAATGKASKAQTAAARTEARARAAEERARAAEDKKILQEGKRAAEEKLRFEKQVEAETKKISAERRKRQKEEAAAAAKQEGSKGSSLWELGQRGVQGLVAAFAVHKVIGFAEGLSESGAELDRLSQSLGVTTDAIQELQFAAINSNVDVHHMQAGLSALAIDAGHGAKALSSLGIAVKDANGQAKSADQLFEEVADKVSKASTQSEKLAIATKAFAGSGIEHAATKLLPLLDKGAAGIQEFREQAQELGLAFDEEALAAIREYRVEAQKFQLASTAMQASIGKTLLPALAWMADRLRGVVRVVRDYIDNTNILRVAFGAALLVAATKTVRFLVNGGLQTAVAWTRANAAMLRTMGTFVALGIAIEDLYTFLTGGESVIGKWLDDLGGHGTADTTVRNLGAGVKILREEIQALLNLDFSKPGFIEAITGFNDARKRTNREADLRGKRAALVEVANGKDPVAARIAARELQKFDKEHFGESVQGRQYATERGVGGGVERIDYGVASENALTGTGSIQNTTNITVNGTNMTPEQIKSTVDEGVQRGLSKAAKKVREAHAPRTGGK